MLKVHPGFSALILVNKFDDAKEVCLISMTYVLALPEAIMSMHMILKNASVTAGSSGMT